MFERTRSESRESTTHRRHSACSHLFIDSSTSLARILPSFPDRWRISEHESKPRVKLHYAISSSRVCREICMARDPRRCVRDAIVPKERKPRDQARRGESAKDAPCRGRARLSLSRVHSARYDRSSRERWPISG